MLRLCLRLCLLTAAMLSIRPFLGEARAILCYASRSGPQFAGRTRRANGVGWDSAAGDGMT
jgi:hypothetical protein